MIEPPLAAVDHEVTELTLPAIGLLSASRTDLDEEGLAGCHTLVLMNDVVAGAPAATRVIEGLAGASAATDHSNQDGGNALRYDEVVAPCNVPDATVVKEDS